MTGRDPRRGTSLDAALGVLSDRYRRRLLVALLENNPQDSEDTQVPDDIEIGDDDLKTLEIHMTHVHLPKLEEEGFVEWSRDANEVRKGPRFEEIRPLLKLMHDHSDELPDDWI